MLRTAQDLQQRLVAFFPTLKSEFTDDEIFDYGYSPPLTFHAVWRAFAPFSYEYIGCLNQRETKQFCTLINEMIAAGGDQENAVSTCFLEHASQLGVRKMIKPYLSDDAKRELR